MTTDCAIAFSNTPFMPAAFYRFRLKVYPPSVWRACQPLAGLPAVCLEGLSASGGLARRLSGGLVSLWRACPPLLWRAVFGKESPQPSVLDLGIRTG